MPLGLERRQNTGQLHFITFSCHHRLPYLGTPNPKDTLEQIIERTRRSHNFSLYAYVLMPEHVHLLLSEPENHKLSSTLRVLKGESSKLLKGSRDHFWQPRYYDFNVFTTPRRSNTSTATQSPEAPSTNPKTTAGAASTTTPPANPAPSKSNPTGPPTDAEKSQH